MAQAQDTLHVDQSATGTNDGSSWGNAYVNLQDALDEVNANSNTAFAVRIAEGTYYPDEDSDGDHTGDDVTESFVVDRGDVELQGGYPAGGGTRDPQAHPAVLSGDVDENDTTTNSGIVERAEDISGSNAHHVLILNAGANTRVDGVFITGGQANGEASEDMAGGGVFVDGADPQFVRVTVTGNQAERLGGGLYNEGTFGTANPNFANVTIAGNLAENGGGLYNNGDLGESSPTLANVLFTGNRATASAGALYNSGVNSGESSPTLTNVTFAGNTAEGGFVCGGGAIYNNANSDGNSEPQLTNVLLWGNSATESGDQICNLASGTTLTVSYSILEGGIGGISENDGSSTIDGGNNLDQDPQFVDADGPDDTVGTTDDDLRLQGPGSGGGASPGIDAGNTGALPADTADLDGDGDTSEDLPVDRFGNPRVQSATGNSAVDIGMFESDGSALPVELTSLEATQSGESAVVLSWTTASEKNNAGFRVQHQPPSGKSWKTLGFVESKARGGTTTDAKTYQFTAEGLAMGTQRFRLKQVDLDGSTALTDLVAVRLQMNDAVRLTAPAPNPVTTSATLSFAVKKRAETTITVYNTLGRKVATVYEGTPQAGEQRTAGIDVSGLPSGTYFLRLRSNGETRTQRLTVVR